MNIKNIENIVNGIVKNEFRNIVNNEEATFTNENIEYKN